MMTPDAVRFEQGSGNVFYDIGLEDAEELFVTTQLAHTLFDTIRAHETPPAQVIERLGITANDLANFERGRTDGFTIEQMLRLFGKLGYDIHVKAVRRYEDETATGTPGGSGAGARRERDEKAEVKGER